MGMCGPPGHDVRVSCPRGEGGFREKVSFTKNTAMRHRRVGGRAVSVTAMLHRQRYRGIEKEKEKEKAR